MKINSYLKPTIPYKYILLAGTLITIILVLQNYVSYVVRSPEWDWNYSFVIVNTASYIFTWAMFTPLIYRVSLIIVSYYKISFAKVLQHGLIGIIIAIVQVNLAAVLVSAVFLIIRFEWFDPFSGHSLQSIIVGVFSSFLEYWIILGLFLAGNFYKKYRDRENELNNAQLNALKMQLHPHFLFNTLHTISSLIDENKESAQKVISQLGFLLRSMLEQNQNHTFPFRDELEYIKSYLDIEEIRFQDRLKIIYDIEPKSKNAIVPSLILQPLVENAIKHGFSKRTDSGYIKVFSKQKDERLEIGVEDDGKGTDKADELKTNSGIGLSNVNNRLQKLYADRFSFEIESSVGKGFKATIRIPFILAKE